MADIAIFRINYKSDFILTLNSDAGWAIPFCIKFWTGAPSQAYFVGYDGTNYTHCAPVDGEPTKLVVQFDDHHLPIGDLKFQIGYHFTVADFPTSVEDEVLNHASVIIEVDDEPAQVMLDLNGETAPEIEFSLPAYANEAQRIANEELRIAAETQRISNEESRIAAETVRQQNETQRISREQARQNNEAQRIEREQARQANESQRIEREQARQTNEAERIEREQSRQTNEAERIEREQIRQEHEAQRIANETERKNEFSEIKTEAVAATNAANAAASLANEKAVYAKAQGDYAKEQGTIAEEDHQRAESDHAQASVDHQRAGIDHTIATSDHEQATTDHTRAESDHTRAGQDHTQAVTDHTTATSDHTQAVNDHTRAESDHTRAESDHAAVEVYVDSLGAFDISAYHATGGVLAKYADLAAAIGTNGANIPDALRKGGMSVKFVQSSDNKYVQYRYMGTATTGSPNPFLDETNWQGVDEEPTAGSDNLVKSGGTFSELDFIKNGEHEDFSDSTTGVFEYSFVKGKRYRILVINLSDSYCNFSTRETPDGSTVDGPFFTTPTKNEVIFTASANTNYLRHSAAVSCRVYVYEGSISANTHDIGILKDSISENTSDIMQLETNITYLRDFPLDIVGYVRYDGLFTENSSARRSDYISTGKHNHIKVYTRISSGGCAVAFFDLSRKFLSDISILGTDSTQNIDMDIPENAAYIIVSQYNFPSATFKIINFNYYNGLIERGLVSSVDKMEVASISPLSIIEKNCGFAALFTNWGFIGDSLSSGNHNITLTNADFPEFSWGQYMCRMTGANGVNFSFGGATTRSWLAAGSLGWGGCKNNPRKNYIIALGCNDCAGTNPIPVGDVTTDIGTYDPQTDTDTNAQTFAGYYAGIIQRLQSIQPKAKIFVVTLPQGDRALANNYNAIIRQMASIFSNIFIIDWWQYGPRVDGEWATRYRNKYHLNTVGYLYTAYLIMNYIDWIVRNNYSSFKDVALIGTGYDPA